MVSTPTERSARPAWWITVSAVLIVAGVIGLVGSRPYAADVRLHQILSSRGVQTSAELSTSYYDPNGGDPSGWTSDVVVFLDQHGNRVTAKIGHHGPNSERDSGRIEVIYDPARPSRVKALQDFQQATASSALLIAIVSGSLTALALGATSGLIGWRRMTRRKRRS